MLAASAVLFGTFLLSSLYLQSAVGTGPLATGLAFLPLALATGIGAHAGTQLVERAGVRLPMAAGFVLAAGGALLLSGVRAHGTYLADVLPGMLVAGAGLGVVLVSVSVAVLTGARDEETGMLSGLNTTGHEVGGSLGVAVLVTIATATIGGATGSGAASALTAGLSDAFVVAGGIALAGSLAALVALPPARTFLPRLRLAPRTMPIH
jgi:hypothetical protein